MPAGASTRFSVSSSVPQGSLISPHLFNLFINDIPIPSNGNLCLFADDTAFYVQVPWKDLATAKSAVLNELSILKSYFNDWKIQLNDSKTEFIMFSKSTRMIAMSRNDSILFNNQRFAWKPVVKYLGLLLDSKLLFKLHIDYVLKKANAICFSTLYCLLSRKSHVTIDSKIRVYKSCIRPILTYGCPVFSNAANCHINKLQLLQNKILRMILDIKWNDFISTSSVHDSAKVPNIAEFINRLTENFYKKVSNHPSSLYATLGQYNVDSLSFRVKHKLPRPLV